MRLRHNRLDRLKGRSKDLLQQDVRNESSALELCGIDAEIKQKFFDMFDVMDIRDVQAVSLLSKHASNLLILYPEEADRIKEKIPAEQIIEAMRSSGISFVWKRLSNSLETLYPETFQTQSELVLKGKGLVKASLSEPWTLGQPNSDQISSFRLLERLDGIATQQERVEAIKNSALIYAQKGNWSEFLSIALEATYYAPEIRSALKQLFEAHLNEIARFVRKQKTWISRESFMAGTFSKQVAAFSVLHAEKVEVVNHSRIRIVSSSKVRIQPALPERYVG